jgi:hypothetical protein
MLSLPELKKDFVENSDVCMSEYLASISADGLTLEQAFEAYIHLRRWADKDNFYCEVEGQMVRLNY